MTRADGLQVILGAGGGTGRAIVDELARQGRRIRAVSRSPIADLPAGVDSIQADLSTVELLEQEARKIGKPLKMPRQQMITILAEVVQELCQPLSVITCATDMLASKALGELSQGQIDIVKMVSESAVRIQMLAKSLEKIAAQPKTLSPDMTIQKSLYQP